MQLDGQVCSQVDRCAVRWTGVQLGGQVCMLGGQVCS